MNAEFNEANIAKKIDQLVSKMTLEEKALLTSGRDAWSTQPIERLDIPYIWMADGPHGLRRAPTTDTWGYGNQAPATCFPTASALSASWDMDLLKEVGAALGVESNALGVDLLLGPGINIKRSPLAGRNFEYFSEDPLLSGKLGAAYINGVQSQGVGATAKHYVANNVETQRMWANSNVDERTLNEIYMTPFEIVVKEAQPWSVMACYNRVQGAYGTESLRLLTDKLKNEWGFKGFVVSDWDAVVDRVQGIRAGMHLEMPGKPARITNKMVVDAVESKELDEQQLDSIVKDLLRIVFMGQNTEDKHGDQNLDEHHQLARKVAAEAITLLKNTEKLLPVDTAKYKKIAVLGEFAVNPRYQGNGSSQVKPARLDKFIDIIRDEYGEGVEIIYSAGYSLANDDDLSLVKEAAAVAADADLALVMAGLPLSYESEGIDRTHINLPPSHNKLISAVAKVQPNTAIILTNGSAIAMPWVDEVSAILETWLGGQAGAGAIADAVFGKVNPSGKLAETFPVRLEDTPAYLNFPGEDGQVIYGERMFVGYRYYDKRHIEPLFPFGHGLSYTDFGYSDLKLSASDITDKDQLQVSLKITNTGKVKGKEVVQLYIADQESTVQRPVKELKAFDKIELEPGQSREVSFTLTKRDFSYYSKVYDRWLAESGAFEILVGSSSRDIRLKGELNLNNSEKLNYKMTVFSFFSEFWSNPQLKPLLIEFMPKWIKAMTPEGKPVEEAKIEDFLQQQPLIKFPYFTGGEVDEQKIKAFIEHINQLTYNP
ncbi:MAG: glycoside hydrolase family 3 C-terminal domain-containing protein [Porticoccaceae bacterium]|nr:glycoside hydrolase family 3 C-terminal domain-containing protein [Porticoccaceae bacterium]